jgi:hypothetical protein
VAVLEQIAADLREPSLAEQLEIIRKQHREDHEGWGRMHEEQCRINAELKAENERLRGPGDPSPSTWSFREHVFAATQLLRAAGQTSGSATVKGGGTATLTCPEHEPRVDNVPVTALDIAGGEGANDYGYWCEVIADLAKMGLRIVADERRSAKAEGK